MKADILAFGAHPDDIEVACGGTLIAAVEKGKTVVAIDLTRGEMGTRGCAETRLQEAAEATKIMGIQARENLLMEDAFFRIDEENIRKVITVIRKYQPEIILCNALHDRHPDHARAAKLVSEAAFLSGLIKVETEYKGVKQSAWRPSYIYHYLQHLFVEPHFVVDISEQIELKIRSILAYKTQFNGAATETMPKTFISEPSFMDTIKGRAGILGTQIGVKYAEGFVSGKTLGIKSFDAFI